MTEQILLGMFHEATPTADTIEQLRRIGVRDEQISVVSSVPYQSEILGRKHVYKRLIPIALAGAVLGFLIGLFLTVGTPVLYPIRVGGQPIIPIPPSIIILFEFTMLGTMIATFGGLLAESRFPLLAPQVYDIRITEGHIGVIVQVETENFSQVEQILTSNGAHHLQSFEPPRSIRRRLWARWGLILGMVMLPTVVILLFAYAVVALPLPDQMVEQLSVAYEEGPRLAAPAAAVPLQGPVLIAGQPGSEPMPVTADSLQRGKVLFDLHCALCHGQSGDGSGPVGVYFSPKPPDLTENQVQSLSDNNIFLVISQGRGIMPSLSENLNMVERWDVIHYVRHLAETTAEGAP